MANIKITDLDAYTDPKSTDVLPAVDVTNDETKKVSIADLMENAGSGTEGSPGIRFDGDSGTGMWRPGNNTLAFSTGGVKRLEIASDGEVTIPGDLTVQGTTTTIDTETLVVQDKNIELGVVDTPTDTTADGGGITLKGATDKTLNWVDSTDSWTSSENVDLASGKTYKINGTDVLSGSTLGSGVTGSSLTSVGTITTGVWNGTALTADAIGADAVNGTKIADDSIDSEHYVDGSIDGVHLSADCVDGTKIADDSIDSEHYVDGSIDNVHVSASAAIAGTKIDPDFGSQTVKTTGVFSAAGGAEATPSITFTGDPDTGIYRPDPNQLAISTGGSGRLFVDHSGNVGVGAAPGRTFQVTNGTNAIVSVKNGTVEGVLNATTGNVNIGSASEDFLTISANSFERARVRADGTFEIKGGGTAGTSPAVSVNPSASANSLVIDSTGKVGLGISTPGSKLHVSGDYIQVDNGYGLTTVGGLKYIADSDDNAPSGGAIHNFFTDNGTTSALAILKSGNIGINTTTARAGLAVALGSNTIPAAGASTAAAVFSNATDGAAYGIVIGANTSGLGYIQAQRTDGTATTYDIAMQPNGGRVGIGTTPTELLHTGRTTHGVHALFYTADGTNNNRLAIYTDTSGSHIQHTYSTAAESLIFDVGGSVGSGTERARIDGGGRLLVGTPSNLLVGSSSHILQTETTVHSVSHTRHGGTLGIAGPVFSFARSRGTTPGSVTAVVDGDNLGYIMFHGANGTDFSNRAAWIACEVDGTPFSGGDTTDLPGRLVFSTTADGTSSPTERMRITSTAATNIQISNNGDYSQALNLGAGSFPSLWRAGVNGSGIHFTTNATIPTDQNGSVSDNTESCGVSNYRWSVIYAATGTINTSDINEKQDIQDLSAAELAVAQELKTLFKTFRWKDAVTQKGDNARIHVGVIAQDVELLFAKHGLDASHYALWCSDTWYEVDGKGIADDGSVYTAKSEGAVKKTRLGVRYDQLLAFVLAAL